MSRTLEMKISLNVLEHLGMNLYSNVPAVLSELVANSWDADATEVNIVIDKDNDLIVVQDNGHGMTRNQVIDRFMEVGFQRREKIGSKTAKFGRDPMGRKGIGKLSSFSIATNIRVHTTRDGEKTSFEMSADKIREHVKAEIKTPYQPNEITEWPEDLVQGTKIILSGIKKRMNKLTRDGLARRLSRRFSIIGPKYRFAVSINGSEIGVQDRGYYKHVQYLWTYGDQEDILPQFTGLKDREPIDRSNHFDIPSEISGAQFSGWIGTTKKPEHLKDEDNENLNKLAIFMRGKVAHEDILDDFGMKEIFADYVVGELHCNFLDADEEEDIATSSRQALKSDDPRLLTLKQVIHSELRNVANRWSEWRREDGAKKFTLEVPEVSKWLAGLSGDTKKKAERWIGRLNTLRTIDEGERRELLKASVLAFESYRRKEQLEFLERLTDESVEPILSVFNDIDDLERSYYGQIVMLRLGVIKALQQKLDENEKEIVIRDHIFDHLWLLDPSWERVKGTEHAEKTISKFLSKDSDGLSDEQKRGRIDIGYRISSGRHIIVELKRGSVSTPVDQLASQIRKYRDGATKLIKQSNRPDWPLEIICLVGKPPREWEADQGPAEVAKTLAAVNARILFYDRLLENSQQAYADYLEEHKKIDKLWNIFRGIDDFSS